MWLLVLAWNFKFSEHKFGFLFPLLFFIWRMFVWQRKLQSFLVFNLGNAAKFLDKQGVWKNLQSLIQIFFLELSVKDLLFRVRLFCNIFGTQRIALT